MAWGIDFFAQIGYTSCVPEYRNFIIYMKNSFIFAGIAVALVALGAPVLGVGMGQKATDEPPSIREGVVMVQASSLLPISSVQDPSRTVRTLKVLVTAYSSTVDQTDDTPFITASGKHVRDGIVATNVLPMGTRIRLPQLYGDRIFVVEDRMHPRKGYQVDIWFPEYWQAKNFGVKTTHIEVLES